MKIDFGKTNDGDYEDRPTILAVVSKTKKRYGLANEPKDEQDRMLAVLRWGAYDRNMVGCEWFLASDNLPPWIQDEAIEQAIALNLPLWGGGLFQKLNGGKLPPHLCER